MITARGAGRQESEASSTLFRVIIKLICLIGLWETGNTSAV